MAPQRELTLREYWLIIKRRKTVILITAACVVIATLMFTLRQPPRYKSSCLISVSDSSVIESAMSGIISPEKVSLKNEQAFVKSLAVMEEAFRITSRL